MRLADCREGGSTDEEPHRYDGELLEGGDSLVVRTLCNLSCYRGNCLMLKRLPTEAEPQHRCERFEMQTAPWQPASRHVGTGICGPMRGRPQAGAHGRFQRVLKHGGPQRKAPADRDAQRGGAVA